MHPLEEYLNAGYDFLSKELSLNGADRSMIDRLELSRTAVVGNLDKTSGTRLLESVHRFLAKRLHPDRNKPEDRDSFTQRMAAVNNVYQGLRLLTVNKIPDMTYFTTLDIPQPRANRIRPDTSAPSRSHTSRRPAYNLGQVEPTNHGWREVAEENLRRYRSARQLGFTALGLAGIAAVGGGSPLITAIFEGGAALVTQSDINWKVVRAAEALYPISAAIGLVAAYSAVGVDLLRGQYSDVRYMVKNFVKDWMTPRPL